MNEANHIEARAAEWLIRRDSKPNDGQDEFVAWLASDPRHRAAYLRLAAAWSRTARMKRLRPEGVEVDADLLSPSKRRRWRLTTWVPLAAAIAAVAVISSQWWELHDSTTQVYRTDIGGLSRVVLSDGSTVTLNTDTVLKVHMWPKRRELVLDRGEAQFAVTHDADRPFEVSAGGRLVRAVGTAFDVRLDTNNQLRVLVTEGRVSVEEEASSEDHLHAPPVLALVAAGEAVVADGQQVKRYRVSTTDASRRLAWETGEFAFQGETLGEVVAEFNRYNRKKLMIKDPSVAALQVGGTFRVLDVDSFLAAVEHSFDLNIVENGNGSVVLMRRGAGPQSP